MNVFEKCFRMLSAFRHNINAPEPKEDDVVSISPMPEVTCAVVGELCGLRYHVFGLDGKDETFYHDFPKDGRPLLLVTADGQNIFVTQGRYRFTDRGFQP